MPTVSPIIPEDSPLRRPPAELSRRQVLILDGIRYAVEMAHIAYERLAEHLQSVTAHPGEPSVRDIAIGMLDAWSIIDSAHRCRDHVDGLPGLQNKPWKRLFMDRMVDAEDLRDCVQHQIGEIGGTLAEGGGQLWGYLSWAEIRDGRYTGTWAMMAAGSYYVGDYWPFVGPVDLPFPVPPGRVRLNAFGKQVYLGRLVMHLIEAANSVAEEILHDQLRPVGPPATERRGADAVYEGGIEVAYSLPPKAAEPPEA